MLTPEQQQLFSSVLSGLGPDFMESFGSFLQPQSQEDLQATFQQTYVDPAMQAFEQQTIPAIQQAFVDANAGSSSALNKALAASAAGLSTQLGANYGQFAQNERNSQLQGINQFLPLLTGSTFSPQFQQRQGILGPLLSSAGQVGGAAIMASSIKVKENIRDYDASLETLQDIEVKMYDYQKDAGGSKDRVGLIAEELPPEFTVMHEEVLHVDLYALIGLLINSVKELQKRVHELEEE